MKRFKVKGIIWIDGKDGKEAFAVEGDEVILLPDNNTLVKQGRNHKVKTYYFNNIQSIIEEGLLEEIEEEPKVDIVNHPPHYEWFEKKYGVALEKITGDMPFNLGNVVKYVIRHGHKFEEGMTTKEKAIQDLEKAIVYLNFEIKRLTK